MASKRRLRRKQCERKRSYQDREAADRAAHAVRRRTGEHIVAYGCRHCGKFHVGHPPQRVRDAIQARRENHPRTLADAD